ncbi:MAG TPA: exopolysaccharide biosynthesis polyprenyl glycosylphosphotransferase [Gemmatimonadaceae bacterium]|nr:exopolysaccharide biosynthesis polyprenyl glycosylphosphotransferase [Gemmatimonadaceae bacterium]
MHARYAAYRRIAVASSATDAVDPAVSRRMTPPPSAHRAAVLTPSIGHPSVVPFPVILQRRSEAAMRQRVSAIFARVALLMLCDLGLLGLVRLGFGLVRDQAVLGPTVAALANALIPLHSFPGFQVAVAVALGLLVFDNYGRGPRRREARTLIAGSTLGLALVFWARLWGEGASAAGMVGFVLAAAILGGLFVAERNAIQFVVERRLWGEELQPLRALAVGSGAFARRVREEGSVGATQAAGIGVVGYVDATAGADALPAEDALGGVSDLVWLVQHHHVDTLLLDDDLDSALFADLLHIGDAAGCRVLALSRGFPVADFVPKVVERNGVALVELVRPSLEAPQLLAKRAMDLVLAGAGLVALAPLLALIALAVRLTSRGPVFFAQPRVGFGGRRFRMYKFRSMVVDAEARKSSLAAHSVYTDPRLFKIVNDPRITRLGAFLRRTSLDELPQLWNVVRGEMSLVGPRPPVLSEVGEYEETHYARFGMKPGITGPWQVGGRNRVTSFDEVVRLETAYMRDWSIWKDFEILFRTVPAVLKMAGAH